MQKYKPLVAIMFCFSFLPASVLNAQVDPDTAQKADIDRFSIEAAVLFVRDSVNNFPGPNEPINFDQEPFITHGLGPGGEFVSYYNFDVQPTEPAPIYVLIRDGESSPVDGQLNIVDVIPGDSGYNDFWEVFMVTVPANYVPNTVTNYNEIVDSGYSMQETEIIVNCPIVPEGSTAELRLTDESPDLVRGWYKGMVVFYFNFSEKALMATNQDMVPVSPIYVTFNINPDQPGGGPPSGFVTDTTGRAHNVVATLPDDEDYSPLWSVNVYDNADFDNVGSLSTAVAANILATDVAKVNCPIVSISSSPVNPDTAQKASVDRFSMEAGILFVRDTVNNFPGPNEAINFDQEPFITHGLGSGGEFVSYYNFDVQPTEPAPIYVLIRDGESSPVEGQLNIVDVIPGDSGYNDFWEVFMVTVPANYIANTITSADEIIMKGYQMQETEILVNCPIVPEGSTAELRYTEEDPGLVRGWYKGMVVFYFNFSEKALMVNDEDMVPTSPIYVTFNINPDQPGGGPPSGFKADTAGRTHNIPATLPEDDTYSPLWSVNIYDNADFDIVHNLESALSANILAMGAAIVNCPIVSVERTTEVKTEGSVVPGSYSLDQNYPNPFNPNTIIRFSLPQNDHVSLKIYNSLGEVVAEIINEVLSGGSYSIEWKAENLPSGIYFYTLSGNSFKETKKMMLMK